MSFLVFLSTFMIPFVIFGIVSAGLLMKKNVYELFVKGAGDGMRTAVEILPTLVGLMVAVGILRASGFLDRMAEVLGKFLAGTGVAPELIPLIIVRLFSASAANGLVVDLFKAYGTDSRIGLTASIIMSCTETVFYTMSIYLMSVKIKKGRYTLAGALLATGVGVCASVLLAGIS